MNFGLTPLGFNAERLADIKNQLENAMIAEFGDVNIDPQSVFGQLIGVLSAQFAALWENLEDVYFSQYPNSASGTSLDNVVQYNGLVRLAAQQTSVLAVCDGNEATLIPAGSLATIPNSNNIFSNPVAGTITADNAYFVNISVISLAAQVYTVILNNQLFSFSLPIITFTGNFVTSNSIVVTINGVASAAIPFNTNNNTTLADIATAIALFPSVASATATNPNIISIVPNSGFNVTVNSIVITGGASQPTYAVTFAVPSTLDQISTYLTAIINSGTPSWNAIDSSGTFTITSSTPSLPFSASVQTLLSIIDRSSPILFLSQDYAPIACPANSLTQILSPVGGWNSINNPVAGITGQYIETDAALRIRRQNSIQLSGNATVEAIRAHLLQDVPSVISALVFENVSIYQAEIDVTFSVPFIIGNTITFTFNTRILPTITYATSSADTMTQLALLIAAQPEVLSCVASGLTLEINMNVFQEVIIETITLAGGASQPSYIISGGRPPKSFECVVEGGSDANIAEEIWLSKPAGIQTYGNTNYTIVDSQGNNQIIYFSRPTPIYVWVTCVLTLYAPETFPVNGLQLVANAINTYINSLGIGSSVLLQRVLAQIFTVPGIASGVMQLAATNSPNDSPSYGSSDITINETQIAITAINMILVTV
jgi:uncharacterized phage protein gp47/JayE